jgi:hypothetical protein
MTDLLEFLRPSSMGAIEHCPGRPAMEARACDLVPFLRDMESIPARQGKLGHEVLAGILGSAFTGDWSRAGEVIATIEGRMSGLEAWTKDAVRQCAAYACALIASLSRRFYRLEILVEEWLDGDGIGVPRGGTADLIVLCFSDQTTLSLVVVDDHKCGFVSQGDAADHLQLGGYGVMSWDRWHPRGGVEVHLAAGRRHEFTSAHYDAPTIAAVRARLRRAAAAARVAAPELRPCRKACVYCRALLFCRPAREMIMDARDDLALFGFDPADRLALQDAAALAKRFAQDADAVLKQARAVEADRASRVTFPAN